ncbi:DUF1254 domain-containing protein [Aquiflexum gelatinilyticum]|uniref:DUF1254 domain-containing protein n=1 Tax=Aquiflexum gelatinilyticum TaxID=2961943 RepID=UPI00216773D7|nr:DUF1254 domain-containing protein [Aquiflexum gelatinilyticum]MCS4434207.1 DUF1254 domain-containing protein [Aquiflexum gelatinilyticum]
MKANFNLLTLAILIFISGCQEPDKKLSPEEARRIAKEAYIYGFPMVMNYKTLFVNAIDKNSGDYKGEINALSCDARLYTPEDKAIVTPNSDTPYCMFWSDIREEPVVFTVPEVDSIRYYSFQFIDLYTHNFAYIGSLTTGNKAGKYLVANENWEGEIPEGITEVIRSETGIFFTIVRTQLFDANDLENVQHLQDQYQLQTLSEYLGNPSAKKEHDDVFPQWVEGEQFSEASFKYLDAMLKFIGEPIEKEKAIMEDFAKLGLGTEEGYSFNNFEEDIQNAIKQGVKDGFAEMEAFIKENSTDPLGSAYIFGSRETLEKSAKEHYNLDNIHLIRAVGAHLGIFGNSASEAIYPAFFVDAEGNPLDGSKNTYTLTFAPNQMPPVKAFWSLTMYDGKTQLLVDNPLDKYLLNSTMKDAFVRNNDGSVTLYVQHESPGANLEANWLPAPNGPFYCIMRLYGPTEAVLEGTWVSPKMVKQNK